MIEALSKKEKKKKKVKKSKLKMKREHDIASDKTAQH